MLSFKFNSEQLPIIIINTNDVEIPDEPRIPGTSIINELMQLILYGMILIIMMDMWN